MIIHGGASAKSKRYLHYMRNGGLPASPERPAGVQRISLSRTTDDRHSPTIDTIDWLTPGGLILAYGATSCGWMMSRIT